MVKPSNYNKGMSNCNSCHQDPCGCNKCEPARYSCSFSIQADPHDKSTWLFNYCGQLHRIKIPKIYETCTNLSVDYSSSSLIYNGECGQDIITGSQLGSIINLDDLRDVEVPDADSCDILVYDPGCSDCGDGCKPRPAMWRNYHIPDAGDCEIPLHDDGYYRVLTKNDCGCIQECRLPAVPDGSIIINYVRDSVPDDPDFPWYYGCYNDTINLHLADNARYWFGMYDLEVTVNYGIQTVRPTAGENVNFRSLITPVVEGTEPNVSQLSSILQGAAATRDAGNNVIIPWGTISLRGTITFIVPKGKEAYLHHEFRLRTKTTGSHYWLVPEYDGKKVPDDIAGSVNKMPHNASRLNALQVVVRPARGINRFSPVADPIRGELDDPIDLVPNVPGDVPDDPWPEEPEEE